MTTFIPVIAVMLVLSALVVVAVHLASCHRTEALLNKSLETVVFIRQIKGVIRRAEGEIFLIKGSPIPNAQKRKVTLEAIASIMTEFDSLMVRYRQMVAEGKMLPNESVIANLSCTRLVLQDAYDKLSAKPKDQP